MSTKNLRLLAIRIEPSGTGDNDENNRLRATSCLDCGYPHAQGVDMCETCISKVSHRRQSAEDDYRAFVGGSIGSVHSHRFGYVDPSDRRQRWLLD